MTHPTHTGPLVYEFGWELLGLDGSPRGMLEGTSGGRLERSIFTERRYGGSLTLVDRRQVDEWADVMLRPWCYVAGHSYPLATVIPSLPTGAWDSTSTRLSLRFFDRTQRLARHSRPHHVGVNPGENVIAVVDWLCRHADPFDARTALTPSPATVRTPMGWEPGTPTLTIINELLTSIGYSAIRTDVWGTYRAYPYVVPAERPLVHEYLPGPDARHLSTATEEHNLDSVHNHVLVVGKREGDEPPPIGEARNTNELDPLSIPRRGVHTRREQDSDVVDAPTAQRLAERLLAEERQTVRSVEFEHVWWPAELEGKERLVTSQGLDLTGVRVKDSWTLTPGTLVRATLREV